MSLTTEPTGDSEDLIPLAELLPAVSDVVVRRPLWEFPPADRPAVIRERRRRFGMLPDDEPVGDHEYS